jgi:hypothetical protein
MVERFETTVQLEGKTATMFEVPLDVRTVFGRARPPVLVTINDFTYRSTIAAYGDRYYLPLNRHNRRGAGVEAGDRIEVALEADTQPRRVEVPDDLAGALQSNDVARSNFEAMSFSHQREYVEWITEAKRPETRKRRIEGAIKRLLEGRTQR